MCGIVGAVAQRNVVPLLLEGLARLEYRGYDSAGLGILGDNGLVCIRAVGRVERLREKITQFGKPEGRVGIAHTRWATHGGVSEDNAHPQVSGHLALVHNGIIENAQELRQDLLSRGYVFRSGTDTEALAHLIHLCEKEKSDLMAAVEAALRKVKGAYALAVFSEKTPGALVAAKKGPPLLLGIGVKEVFLASDSAALAPLTSEWVPLEDGDVAMLTESGIAVRHEGTPVRRPSLFVPPMRESFLLPKHRHHMHQEIHEQPEALAETLSCLSQEDPFSHAFGQKLLDFLPGVERVVVVACGTSLHAGLLGKRWIESLARLPVDVDMASEFRACLPLVAENTLLVLISQSGETADTLGALEHACHHGQKQTLAICNVPMSTLARLSENVFLTRAGPEVGVASTKAFTTQLAALFLLALAIAKAKGRLFEEDALLGAMKSLPQAFHEALGAEDEMSKWAQHLAKKEHTLFGGRGLSYPIALEGALKLKEITYIHAEGLALGELKHGPLALVDSGMPLVVLAPPDDLLPKVLGNLKEVEARGGELFVIGERGAAEGFSSMNAHLHLLPSSPHPLLRPLLQVLPLQLLAYHTACWRGTDVDKPRNLAKSVTVE